MNRELLRATEDFHFRDADDLPSGAELLPKSKRTCAECIDGLFAIHQSGSLKSAGFIRLNPFGFMEKELLLNQSAS